ncbi:PREDICTED: vesicle-associated protein 1-2-like [Erythranthe guttata]|uniref:vesicle-associated protein 1-2-like n=1 Tax=Erythranthe guttata TaxID=4155 RepID=UPI00064DF381|nr:PREDICTED: vesicle-associated protein 1-2-like [Erythranthe guttata]|eukprot:XP_012843179.1 PREDICTED: vesicle-associated protein 1-2-like [Erythranthe guttata]
MSMQKLLDIDPQQAAFRLKVGRQLSRRIKISNNSQGHVAFKVMTTNVDKYFSQPNAGVLSPGECLEITVIMQTLTEIPSNMECNDEFLIRSVVATPLHTPETAHELFSEGTRAFEDCNLKVVYVSPNAAASQLNQDGNLTRPWFLALKFSGITRPEKMRGRDGD